RRGFGAPAGEARPKSPAPATHKAIPLPFHRLRDVRASNRVRSAGAKGMRETGSLPVGRLGIRGRTPKELTNGPDDELRLRGPGGVRRGLRRAGGPHGGRAGHLAVEVTVTSDRRTAAPGRISQGLLSFLLRRFADRNGKKSPSVSDLGSGRNQ